jgi:hypothetical protein
MIDAPPIEWVTAHANAATLILCVVIVLFNGLATSRWPKDGFSFIAVFAMLIGARGGVSVAVESSSNLSRQIAGVVAVAWCLWATWRILANTPPFDRGERNK